MSVRSFVRTTPISRASVAARSLSDCFGPPVSRILLGSVAITLSNLNGGL